MLNSSYVSIFVWPLAAILEFRKKKQCSAPGKLWEFCQVIQDDHQLYIIFSIFVLRIICLKFLDY